MGQTWSLTTCGPMKKRQLILKYLDSDDHWIVAIQGKHGTKKAVVAKIGRAKKRGGVARDGEGVERQSGRWLTPKFFPKGFKRLAGGWKVGTSVDGEGRCMVE